MASFAFVKGLSPEIFLDWVHLKGLARDNGAEAHFKYPFLVFEENPVKYTFYGYNVAMNQYQQLDGTPVNYRK